ncbi:GNAT family N-acetyltransferase [Ruminococcus sp.]|uniref:GNAT family N-acetyltransferase n=1 Tax=Ruminococcus sp. TaxID=41978 RepID=UPI0025EDADC3|nr:GNAT family N-acetyltransferase [Ruminococcus sp.]MBQ8966319.1 GNAT family N-acetyltransferase [Ruminococcus sp.]
MELRLVSANDSDKLLLDEINSEAFPENERTALDELYASGGAVPIDILGIYENGVPAGYFAVRKWGRLRYMAYFAVRADLRCRGIGSRALGLLREYYPHSVIVLEFEAPDASLSGNDVRLRRRAFYLRSGFCETGWYTFYDGVELELACSEQDFDAEAFMAFAAHLHLTFSDTVPKFYRKD